MICMALDVGDVWTGVAISDARGILAMPLTTIKSYHLLHDLKLLIDKHQPQKVIVGDPILLSGNASKQTQKVRDLFRTLQQAHADIEWVLHDERFSSFQADELAQQVKKLANKAIRIPSKAEKIKSHARAAAIILQDYLDAS